MKRGFTPLEVCNTLRAYYHKTNKKLLTGFTLVELIVVVGIVALIASMALANFPSFKGRLSVDREASKIGLALRKAQQYSSGVRRFEETFITNPSPATCTKGLYEAQFPAYGLAVSMIAPKEYDIYADPDCDRKSASYPSPADPTDLVEAISLESGTSIFDICVNIDSQIPTCSEDGVESLDVWYIRPSPTLSLTVNGERDVSQQYQSAKIVIKGADGSKKSIVIRKTGQISIQNEPQ